MRETFEETPFFCFNKKGVSSKVYLIDALRFCLKMRRALTKLVENRTKSGRDSSSGIQLQTIFLYRLFLVLYYDRIDLGPVCEKKLQGSRKWIETSSSLVLNYCILVRVPARLERWFQKMTMFKNAPYL